MAVDAKQSAEEPMLFFPHDSNAATDEKCIRLILRRGFEGYGRWWRVCEFIAGNSGHRIKYKTEEDMRVLARTLEFDHSSFDELMAIEECKEFINDLLELGLLEKDGAGMLKSSRMDRNAIYSGSKKANGSKGGRPRKNKAPVESVSEGL